MTKGTIRVNEEGATMIPAGTCRVTEGGLLWELLSCPDTEDMLQEQSPLPDEQHREPGSEYHSKE